LIENGQQIGLDSHRSSLKPIVSNDYGHIPWLRTDAPHTYRERELVPQGKMRY
jgi:hypothetical protein